MCFYTKIHGFFECFFKIWKPGNFVKHGIFWKKHGICKIDSFLNGEFLKKHGIFLGNSRRTLNGEFFKNTEVLKKARNSAKKWMKLWKTREFRKSTCFWKMHEFLQKCVNFSTDVIFGKMHEFEKTWISQMTSSLEKCMNFSKVREFLHISWIRWQEISVDAKWKW